MQDGQIELELGPSFADVTDELTQRLQFLRPHLTFSWRGNAILIRGAKTCQTEELRGLVAQVAYQQRIFKDTLAIRKKLYNG